MAGLFATSVNLETALSSAPGGYTGPFTSVIGTPTINVGTGPAGNNTLTLPSGSGVSVTTPDIPSLPVSFALGFGLAMSAAPSAPSFLLKVAIGSNICTLSISASGALTWTCGPAFSAVTASSTFLFNGSRQYIGVYISGIGVSQTAKVEYEGTVLATVSGVSFSGANFASFLWQADSHVVASPTLDSLYIVDLTGSARNFLLGKRVVTPQISAGVGQFSQGTPNGAPTVWQGLAPIPPAGDSIYVADGTPGDQSAVAMSAPFGLSTVDFVMQRASARQEVAGGGRTLELGVGNGSAITYGAAQALPVTYSGLNQVWDKDPTTGVDWVLGNLGSRQAAIKTAS